MIVDSKEFVEVLENSLKASKHEALCIQASMTRNDDPFGYASYLHQRYVQRKAERIRQRFERFFASLQSYSEVVKVCLQGSPTIVCLVWAGVFFVLEVSAQYTKSLGYVAEIFDRINRSLLRFSYYRAKFVENAGDSSVRLKRILNEYNDVIVETLRETSRFCKRRFIANVFSASFGRVHGHFERRLAKMKDLNAEVEIEARISSDEDFEKAQQYRHQELLHRLTSNDASLLIPEIAFENLPNHRNYSFYARESELDTLRGWLKPGRVPEKLITACLCGLGGVGKTQIALEFAYRFAEDYNAILWISADTSLNIDDSFSSIAREVGIADDTMQNPNQLRGLVKRWLLRNTQKGSSDSHTKFNWLMIYDNVGDSTLIDSSWPSTAKGTIILTTRSPDAAREFATHDCKIDVQCFSLTDAQEFLLRLVKGSKRSKIVELEVSRAKDVCQTIGCLPLAIDLLGSYIASCGISTTQFLELHPEFERDLLFDDSLKLSNAQKYQSSIDTTWTLAGSRSSRIPSTGEKPRILLQMLAFLDGSGITLSLFQQKSREEMLFEGPDLISEFPKLEKLLQSPFSEPKELSTSLAVLHQASLIDRNQKHTQISCHQLVQIAVLRDMSPEEKLETFNRLLFILNAAFPHQPDGEPLHEAWKYCEDLSCQVLSLLNTYAKYIDELGCPILLCEIATRCSWFFVEKGQYRMARDISQKANAICDRAIRIGNHPGYSNWFVRDMSTFLYNVQASAEFEMTSPDSSLALHVKIRDIREDNKRPGDPVDQMWIEAANGNIAVSLMAENQPAKALTILQNLLERDDLTSNIDNYYLNNMSLCLRLLDRLDEALEYCEKALSAARKLRGDDSVSMALSLFHLGNIRWNQYLTGQISHEKAVDAFEKCLSIRTRLIPDHHYTAFTLHKLGTVLSTNGDLDVSIGFFEEALEILKTSECHPGAVCRTAFALSETYNRLENSPAAMEYGLEGIDYRDRINTMTDLKLSTTSQDYDKYVGIGHR